jgi:hypothetical protein
MKDDFEYNEEMLNELIGDKRELEEYRKDCEQECDDCPFIEECEDAILPEELTDSEIDWGEYDNDYFFSVDYDEFGEEDLDL